MKQMELSTETEKHKKTQNELDGCPTAAVP